MLQADVPKGEFRGLGREWGEWLHPRGESLHPWGESLPRIARPMALPQASADG